MATATAPNRTNEARPTPKQPSASTPRPTNVGDGERWASLIGGGLLTFLGLSQGTLGGLGAALLGGGLLKRGATGRCELYSALGVNTTGPRGEHTSIPAARGVKLEQVMTIQRSPEELYRYWRQFENLPRFMVNLQSVKNTGGNRSHWVAKGPMGVPVAWDAEIITDKANEVIAWRSLPGSAVDTAGSVHFTPAPANRGTEVRVVMKYDPPGGKVGAAVAWMFGQSAEMEVREDLRRFKRIMETGELPTTDGQSSGVGRHVGQQSMPRVIDDRFAWGLGMFGVGLGLAELLAPGVVGGAIGLQDGDGVLQMLGLREIASGLGILTQSRPAVGVWSRVAGDAMDLTLLGAALASPNTDHARASAATAAVLSVTALDLLCALRLSRDPRSVVGGSPQRATGL